MAKSAKTLSETWDHNRELDEYRSNKARLEHFVKTSVVAGRGCTCHMIAGLCEEGKRDAK